MERNPTERNSTQQFSADRGHSGRGTLLSSVATGLGFSAAGMAAMYFLDPQRGARRRGLAANRFAGTATRAPRALRATGQDMANRAYGVMAETLNLFRSDDASDQVIEARVRARMGHAIPHPGGVQVRVSDGHVTLEGDVLASEEAVLLACVNKVRGVQGVENRLTAHETAGKIPHLHGNGRRRGAIRENWSPAARVVAGAAGLATTMLGTSLLTRSITNSGPTELLGISGRQRSVDITKTVNVNQPVEVVYTMWSNFDYFPRFMSNVLEVRRGEGDRSHWKVRGPAGTTVEWDAKITQKRRNEIIAWRSIEGATVPNAGYVLFEPNEQGGTEVTVRLSYSPPAGAVGHVIAKAFGADPKSEMDEDLMRMKEMIETGNVPPKAAQSIDEGGAEAALGQSSGR